MSIDELTKNSVGLTELDARMRIRAAGFDCRTISRDGKGRTPPPDRTDRVNLKTVDGIVVEAFVG